MKIHNVCAAAALAAALLSATLSPAARGQDSLVELVPASQAEVVPDGSTYAGTMYGGPVYGGSVYGISGYGMPGGSWHAGYYYTAWYKPVPLVVPPTATYQTHWGWGVCNTRVTPIYPQYVGPMNGYGYEGGEGFRPTPYWPSDTNQFGVYYIRAPW